MQVTHNAAFANLATALVKGNAQARAEYDKLDVDEQGEVQSEVRKQAPDDDTFVQTLQGVGIAPLPFLAAQTVDAGQGAAVAGPAPAGTSNVLGTLVKERAVGAGDDTDTQLPEDPLAAAEVLKQDNDKVLGDVAAAVSPTAQKATQASIDRVQQASDKVTSQAGSLGMNVSKLQSLAQAQAARGPESAAAADAKMGALDQQMRQGIAQMLGIAMPTAAEPTAAPDATDPATPAAPQAPPVAPAPTTAPAASTVAPAPSAQKLPDLTNVLTAPQKSAISMMLQANAPIEAILVAVMLLMLDQNDDDLRKKMDDQQNARESADKLRTQRAALDDTAIAGDRTALDSAQRDRAAIMGSVPASTDPKADPTASLSPDDAAKVKALDAKIAGLRTTIDAHDSQASQLDDQISKAGSSNDRISFELQQLVDKRKNTFDQISQMLQTFNQMAQTAIQNMRV